MNFKAVIHIISLLTAMVGLAMFTCLIPGHLMNDDSLVLKKIAFCATITVASSLFAFNKTKNAREDSVRIREGFAIVTVGWVAASLFGALPYLYAGDMLLVDAFFEAMSGFTTTGASILTDIEAQPKSLLYWRSFTNWMGGMGIVVLGMVILPYLGVGGMQIYKAETTGPVSEQLTSRVATTAKSLWLVYFGLTLILIVLLRLGSMPWYEAICHGLSTMSTGGFSPKGDSVASYSSYIQLTMSLFMFLAATNFILHFHLLRGKFTYFKDDEWRHYFYLIILSITIITASLINHDVYEPFKAFVHATFQTATILSSAGFASADFTHWPPVIQGIFVLLMITGACGGSTCGGLKISRVLLMFRYSLSQIKNCVFPHALSNVQMNKQRIKDDIMDKIFSFVFLYSAATVIISTLLLLIADVSLIEAFSAALTCMANVGPGIGDRLGPAGNFGFLPESAKWLLSFTMLLGRLEVYTVIVLILPVFWKK